MSKLKQFQQALIKPTVRSCLQDIWLHRPLRTGFLYPCKLDTRTSAVVWCTACGVLMQQLMSVSGCLNMFYLAFFAFSFTRFTVVSVLKMAPSVSTKIYKETDATTQQFLVIFA